MPVRAQASINGGEFYPAEVQVRESFEMVRSESAVKPDPEWEHTDSNGHFHAFAGDEKTPTLTRYDVQIACDGSCGDVCEGEGYSEPRWKCAICGEAVEPQFIPDVKARTKGIRFPTSRSASVRVHGTESLPQIGQVDNGDGTFTLEVGSVQPVRVSLRVRSAAGEMIGSGYVGPCSLSSDGHWTLEIESAQLDPRLTASA